MSEQRIRLDVWADVRCPWCWMGHRRLMRAVAESAVAVQVRRRSFLLEPRGPHGSRRTVGEVAVAEWGMTETSWSERRALIERTGLADGLRIRIDTALSIDSRPAHRVLKLAAARGLDEEAAWEALYATHLERNLDLENTDHLADVGEEIGLPRGEVVALADSDLFRSEVDADHRSARAAGVSAVPTIVHGDRMLSGARSVDEITAFLRSAGHGVVPTRVSR